MKSLLDRLRAHNQADGDLFPQRIEEPGRTPARVPSLAEGRYVRISPMIRERFRYAASWTNASCGQTWLSIEDMARVWTGRKVQKHLATAREHWDGHVLALHPASRLSLLGIDLEEGNSTFLLWPAPAGREPRVVMYSGHDSQEFAHFEAHLLWLLGEQR